MKHIHLHAALACLLAWTIPLCQAATSTMTPDLPSASSASSASPALPAASASASAPVRPPVAPSVIIEQPLERARAAAVTAYLRAHGALVSVRRYAGQSDIPEAVSRIEQAFVALLQARGVPARSSGSAVEPRDGASASIDIDPSFYVYTQKFNAQRVRLPVYVAAQLQQYPGAPGEAAPPPVAASDPPADVLRVAAGALGIVTGFLSPSHGAYMLATGSRLSNALNERTAALFGSGPAPTRLFGSHLERYRRGEQEATVAVRIRTADLDERVVVKASAPGDDPPFAVDALTAAAWQGAVEQLVGPVAPQP